MPATKVLLKSITPEQENEIPNFIKKYSEPAINGKYFEDFKFENAEKLIDWMYVKAGFKKPVVLVARSPYEAQVMFNYIKHFSNALGFVKLLFDMT